MSGDKQDEAPGRPDAGHAISTAVIATPNPWLELKRFTDARIALGRSGVSLPTAPHLGFQLAHAQARDAVHVALDVPALLDALRPVAAQAGQDVLPLHSAAADRQTYLKRPDLGRRLDAASRQTLLDGRNAQANDASPDDPSARPFDLAFVVADGLSPLAIGLHAEPFLRQIVPNLQADGWRLAPITLVTQSRVALADEVGELLGARLVVILIGERPGLSSPDSMGLYMTWMPKVGRTDAERNCISNIRQAGLGYSEAARKLQWLLRQARERQVSGVPLKEEG